MTDPLSLSEVLSLDEVGDELRQQFNNLEDNIVSVGSGREEEAYETLNEHIQQAVTNMPILARLVSEGGWSLLQTTIYCHSIDTSHHAIKCLVQAYPPVLLGSRIIFLIAHDNVHCTLMPWIATEYPRVFDNNRGRRLVFDFLYMYSRRRRTSCTSTILKNFFEAYPQAFTLREAEDDTTILHTILQDSLEVPNVSTTRNFSECEAELFKWMANRCPDDYLLETVRTGGYTLLHLACESLAQYKGNDSSEICKYLIDNCPAPVRTLDHDGQLPIHILQNSCDHRVVREVVVCLLREYPESHWAQPLSGRPPSDVPFIQSIKPFLDEERELKETIASLEESKSSLTDAVACTNNQLTRSAFAVYDAWATSFINTTEDKLQPISSQLQDMCNEGLESDE